MKNTWLFLFFCWIKAVHICSAPRPTICTHAHWTMGYSMMMRGDAEQMVTGVAFAISWEFTLID